jgi:uncharacterized protein YecT (DUF1311 family)
VRVALILLTFAAAPATAQIADPEPWRARFDGCLAAGDLAACTGAPAARCMAGAEGGRTQPDMAGCTATEAVLPDEILNADWPGHRARAEEGDDAVRPCFGEKFAGRAEGSRAARAGWIAFRDAKRAPEYAAWDPGSMRGLPAASCAASMTADRVAALRALTGGM